jgi:hypothetical protein
VRNASAERVSESPLDAAGSPTPRTIAAVTVAIPSRPIASSVPAGLAGEPVRRHADEAVRIAQTNLQLYNQLREAGRPLGDLVVVHRAYEFLITLYPGYFQGDGKPFVAHGLGVASILAHLDQPAEILAVGLLHNIYGNGDFGDGEGDGATPARRALVRREVGERIDELLVRFRDLRIHPSTIDEVRRSLPELGDTDRRLILVELGDYLEKYVDLGVLYFGESDWLVGARDRIGDDLIEVARELGQPRLADMLSTAFAEADANAGQIPAELRPADGRRYLKLVVARSCQPRPAPERRAHLQWLRRRVRLRTRLRGLRAAAAAMTSRAGTG